MYALSLCHVIAHEKNSEGCIQILRCYDPSNFKRPAHSIEETNMQVGIDLIHEHVIVRLRHSLPDGKLQKEERALCFTAGLL